MRRFSQLLVATLPALLLLGLTLGAEPTDAHAQQAPSEPVSAQNFVPAPGRGNYLMVEGAQTAGRMAPAVGLWFDYAHEPFVLHTATCVEGDPTNCQVVDTRAVLAEYIATANLTGALTLFDRLQIGLVLPFSLSSGEPFQILTTPPDIVAPGGSTAGLGDLRISAKLHIFGAPDGLAVGVSAYGTVPLARFTAAGSFIGNSGPLLGGQVLGEFAKNHFHLAANVGGYWRQKTLFLSTQGGPRITYGLALSYDITPLVSVLGEVIGASSFTAQVDENALEGNVAARLTTGDFMFTLGGGPGLIQGVGVPVFRAMAGAMWAPNRTDTDGDGVVDTDDACIDVAEDLDGYDDTDGCPDADNDGDGMPDETDRCPDEAEDVDQFEDTDGCPDRDNDHDGVQDGYDSCPMVPEDMDGDRDTDGCPDNDRDRDGIPDETDHCADQAEDTDGYCDADGCPETDCDNDSLPDDGDQCPDQAENFNGFEDTDGCPDVAVDSDGDGIADPADRCPHDPETLNGVDDEDGCPDGRALVRVLGNTITLLQQVNFATASATITGAQSFTILDVISVVLLHNPAYAHVRIEGHTDNRGDHDANLTLSQARAQACLDYLVTKGLPATRFSAQGFGPDRPIDTGRSARAQAKNRRVEFIVETAATMEPAPAATPAATPAAATPAATPAAAAPAADPAAATADVAAPADASATTPAPETHPARRGRRGHL